MSNETLKNLVGETVINDMENITNALKLQEIIKKKIEEENERPEHVILCSGHCCSQYHEMPLKVIYQKLLKDSKK